jgi:hypothetical protein
MSMRPLTARWPRVDSVDHLVACFVVLKMPKHLTRTPSSHLHGHKAPRPLVSCKHRSGVPAKEAQGTSKLPVNSSSSSWTDRTEHQLLASKSNYELLQSDIPLSTDHARFSSFQASIAHKRAHHQREEKMRRDRMKRALGMLAAVLPPEVSTASANGVSRNTNRAETVEQAVEYINSLHRKLDSSPKPIFKH